VGPDGLLGVGAGQADLFGGGEDFTPGGRVDGDAVAEPFRARQALGVAGYQNW
jgi:hypothetical protein